MRTPPRLWPTIGRPRRLRGLALLWAGLSLAAAPAAGQSVEGEEPGAGFVRRELSGPFRVLDGDTFEADMNGDGAFQLPDERVRLLYVDTPELRESDKGVDRERGLRARALLAEALERRPVVLATPIERPRGNYGRMLGLVTANGSNVSLELIRAGLSYFDTRFSFPPDYERYARAEGEAFTEGLGIWSDAASRQSYLRRLEREKKTPRSPVNPLYGGEFQAEEFDPTAHLRTYVRVTGRLIVINALNPRSIRLRLQGDPEKPPVHAVAFAPTGERLGITDWPPGATVVLEGFVRGYRNRPNIIVHYGTVVPSVAVLSCGAPAGDCATGAGLR